MLTFDYEIKLPNANQLIKEFGLEPYGRLQYVVDSSIVMYSAPYTPRNVGRLQGSVNDSIGSGMLEYTVPYAHYQWVGIKKNGEKFDYQHINPKADNRWVERAMEVHLQDVCRIAEKELRDGR